MKRPAPTEKQVRAFKYALKHPYSILAVDPRLGKSRVIIGIQKRLKLNCLVVCPGYLVPNWPKEINKWGDPGTIITTFERGKDIYDVCDSDFVIISYDLAKKAEQLFEWANMVVIDEAHNIKSMSAQRTQFIHRVIYENSIGRVHPMTGTILKNRVKEFYSPLALMHYDPRVAQSQFLDRYPSEIDFADQFSFRHEYKIEIKNRFVTVVKWDGLKNTDELKTHLKGHYLRIKADANDLPPVEYRPILVSNHPDPALLAAFNSYFAGEGAGSVKPEQKKEAAIKKVPFTIKYTEDLLQQVNCAMVYSDHVPSADAIAQHFGVRALTGRMPGKMRSRLAKEFQAGAGKILVATVGALKEGEDLYRSKDIVLNDLPWVPGDLTQVVNRIRRIGDKKPCTVHKIHGSPQDEYISNALQEKMDVIERAT